MSTWAYYNEFDEQKADWLRTLILFGHIAPGETEEFRAWLEARFLPGMSWDNRGEWELDHKRPVASFDLTDPAQLAAAMHYTNLQPLWRSDNRRKGAKCL